MKSETTPLVQPRASKNALKMLVRRRRVMNTGVQKVREVDGEFVIPEELKITIDGQLFYQKDVKQGNLRVLLFTTLPNMQRLGKAEYWLVDGTFSTSPLQFTQLYSIHAPVGQGDSRRVVPLVFFLLNKKTKKIYNLAFETLLDMCRENSILLKPKYVLSDFEKAVVNTIRDVLPETECFGCFFHFTQNLIRQLSSLGHKVAYSNQTDVYMAVKKIQALSFLPADRIEAAYIELKTTLPTILQNFFEYFEQTYVTGINNNGRPLFHPRFWSNNKAVVSKIPKSTNHLEAWHRRWTALVGASHLSMTTLIRELRKEQHETEGKILCVLQGESELPMTELDAKIMQKCISANKVSDSDFIQGMALILASKNRRS